jgi:hypothetical protein
MAYTRPISQPEKAAEKKGEHGNRKGDPPQAVKMESADS